MKSEVTTPIFTADHRARQNGVLLDVREQNRQVKDFTVTDVYLENGIKNTNANAFEYFAKQHI